MWETIIQFLSSLRCMVIINQYERGVLLRCGKLKRELPPGLHLLCPIIDDTIDKSIVPEVIDLPNISVEARSGRSIAASGNIQCRIVNIRLACLAVQDLNESLKRMAWGEVAEAIREHDETDIDPRDAALESISEKAEAWGVAIDSLWLTDYAPVRVLRLLQS